MSTREKHNTHQKALALHLDTTILGSFAEIRAGFSAHLFRERSNRLRYETDADGDRWRERLTREHAVHVICAEARAHLDTRVESLSQTPPTTDDVGHHDGLAGGRKPSVLSAAE